MECSIVTQAHHWEKGKAWIIIPYVRPRMYFRVLGYARQSSRGICDRSGAFFYLLNQALVLSKVKSGLDPRIGDDIVDRTESSVIREIDVRPLCWIEVWVVAKQLGAGPTLKWRGQLCPPLTHLCIQIAGRSK